MLESDHSRPTTKGGVKAKLLSPGRIGIQQRGARNTLSRIDAFTLQCMLRAMWRFANIRVARMSSGQRCLIRDLGLVKGGKGLRHHELVLEVSGRGLVRFAATRIRSALHHINRKPPEQLGIRDGAGLMADQAAGFLDR
jgi:hypothetical protein